jgi:hypothetical protein
MQERSCPLPCTDCRAAKFIEMVMPLPENLGDNQVEEALMVRRRVCGKLNPEQSPIESLLITLAIGQRMAAYAPD